MKNINCKIFKLMIPMPDYYPLIIVIDKLQISESNKTLFCLEKIEYTKNTNGKNLARFQEKLGWIVQFRNKNEIYIIKVVISQIHENRDNTRKSWNIINNESNKQNK